MADELNCSAPDEVREMLSLIAIYGYMQRLIRPRPELFYHYCSVGAMQAILESRRILLTSFYYMNDYMECRWLDQLIRNAPLESQVALRNGFAQAFWAVYNIRQAYLACFSEESDLLSQWRAYADDGQGVSIGFNLDHFGIERALPHTNVSANSGMGLHNVIYDPKEQRAIVDFLVREAIASESRISPQNAGCELANAFKRIATIVKNPAFQEEREWRLICLPLIFYDDDRGILPLGAPSPVKHISKPDALYPYLEFDFSTSTREVIHEIVLGPRNRTDINDMFIFLRNLGYTKCAPRRSCATYR